VQAINILLFRRGQVSLQDACEILDIYGDVVAFLRRQAVFLRQLSKDLRQTFH
jgi:predicted HTH domain antitoxin